MVSGSLRAMDVLTADQLAAFCLQDAPSGQLDGTACMVYVRGFIDGAIATDPQVVRSVTEELESTESFSERAVRTRIGSRVDRYGPSVFAGFCVPDPVPLSEITDHVIGLLRAREAGAGPAREVVYQALRANYPCGDR